MKNFCDYCVQHFKYLESEYDFRVAMNCYEEWGGEVLYVNKTTGVKLNYEIREAFINVFIFKLVDGEVINNPSPFLPDSEVRCFDIQFIVPDDKRIKSMYEYGEDSCFSDSKNGFSTYVQTFSDLLREYGKDVLSGDFSVLPKVEKLIKSNVFGND